MTRLRWWLVLTAGVTAVALVLAACSTSGDRGAAAAPRSSAAADPTAGGRPTLPSGALASTPAAPSSAPVTRTATVTRTAGAAQLPRGGTRILGRFRVVADYGAPGTDTLGVLGRGTPGQAAAAVQRRAAAFAGFGEPVQPAMELIATVAQGSPGPDGDYSQPVPASTIARYLAAAHRDRMLLLLDLQPGRASFLSQARALRPFLLDPSVGLGLDPEWKVGAHARPGNGLIGSSSAAGINAVLRWTSALVQAHHLPDKLVVVHQFTDSMLPDRGAIADRPGVEAVFHADGFGTPRVKRHVFRTLHFPGRPFGIGFKLFLHQDHPMMTPRQVLALRPRPDVITYE